MKRGTSIRMLQWWMWAVVAGVIFIAVVAWLLSQLFAVGYPGLEFTEGRAVASSSGTEQIVGTVVNASYRNYKDIVLNVRVMDSAGQVIDDFDHDIGDIASGERQDVVLSPKGNLGPAFRFQVDIGSKGGNKGIPWWVWVLIGTLGLISAASVLWASVAGYRFPGLEIVAAHLEPRDDGGRSVVARIVNYSKRDFERIVVHGAILDQYDRDVETISHFVGVVGAKSQREFTLSPRNQIGG